MTSYYYPLSDAYIVTAIEISTKHINSITLYCLLLLILILTLLYVTKFNINIEICTKHCLKLFFNFKFALRKFMQHIPCAEQPGAARSTLSSQEHAEQPRAGGVTPLHRSNFQVLPM